MKDTTLLSSVGRNPDKNSGTVNVPVHRASTIVSPSVKEYENAGKDGRIYRETVYGALGTPSSFALCDAVCALEQGAGSAVTSTGLAACTQAILPFVSQGDHLLVTDSVYGPTRTFCDTILARFGVETTYFDPHLGAEVEKLIRPNTRLIFTEAPGSLTFEMQDIPAIVKAAHAHDCLVLIDNTWASPLYFKPLNYGVDISIQAATKYLSGHSDVVLGVITARTEEQFIRLKDSLMVMGEMASPDDCYLVLRGMRSLVARMEMQQRNALRVTTWLSQRPEVTQVLYPPLPGAPGHDIWKRDFTGAGAVFGVLMPHLNEKQVSAMLDNYSHFSIGASWGGFESLVVLAHPEGSRSAVPWDKKAQSLIRFSVGMEDPDDLIADLDRGFQRLAACK